MRLLVTGSAGFLGRYVVTEAGRRGHTVRAMVRPTTDASQLTSCDAPNVEVVRSDLRARPGLVSALSGVDAVVHLAAAKTGDLYDQMAGTVVATENLLEAMLEAGVDRLIAVSSFSVYDYRRIWTFGILDERSPLESRPEHRDPYAYAKLMQEELIRRHTVRHNFRTTVLRPGVVYGPGSLWTDRLGARVSPRLWLRISPWSRLPLTYVENCAEAIAICAEEEASVGCTFNIVDDETPRTRSYIRMLQRRTTPRPRVVPIPWTLMRALAGLATLVNRCLFKGGAKVPQILRPAALSARCKPLRYTSHRLQEAVGWRPRYALAAALERCTESGSPVHAVARSERVTRQSAP